MWSWAYNGLDKLLMSMYRHNLKKKKLDIVPLQQENVVLCRFFFLFFIWVTDHSPLTFVSWGVCGTSALFKVWAVATVWNVKVQIHFCEVQIRIHYTRTPLLGFRNRLCGAVKVLGSAMEVQSRDHFRVEQTPSVDGLLQVNDGWKPLLLCNTRALCFLVSSVFCSVWGNWLNGFLEVPYGLQHGHITTYIENK